IKTSHTKTSDTKTSDNEISDKGASDTENLDEEILGQENIDITTSNKKTLRKKVSNKKRWIWAAGICSLTAAVIVTGALVLRKEIKINPIVAEGYEVHGVDVSHYQGTIDWDVLSQQNLDFAFIKATEGSTHVDECFLDNWQAAEQTNLYLGAYHFFSFDSEGGKQAASYIDTVGNLNGKLAPVVDVEYYGNKRSNPPKRTEVVENLGAMLDALEQYYEIKPIIYTTYTVYNDYIKGEFEDYPLWVRSVYCPPSVFFGNKWSFWQYMDTATLDGYTGDQKYIDVNVFKGTRQELEGLMIQKIMY
ncbi:MAG: glycoside hydrolase family 25 protein, partial [Lachnospiraceae bacterium]|nr:glycoside hydrolase family 25 protein [Lachnospiraceae bacterium]